ncbi:MAG: phosphoadenylyl-sulfate reductase [Actinomycetota bacterium]
MTSVSQAAPVDVATLRQQVDLAAARLDSAPAEEIIRWAVQATGGQLAVACSMQDALVPHIVSTILPGVDVLFLDTGYHFPETLATRSAVRRALPVSVVNVRPAQTVAEQDADYGPRLHDRDPNLCCFLRKVDPLARALEGYAGWVSGVRRVESDTRADTPAIAWDEAHDRLKINPLVTWSDSDVEEYQERHHLPRNPLTYQGYPSIGCAPCTRAVAPGEDPRAGRWSGQDKVECGLHI